MACTAFETTIDYRYGIQRYEICLDLALFVFLFLDCFSGLFLDMKVP